MSDLVQQVLTAHTEFVKRNRMRPDMLLVNSEQMYELMHEVYCHGEHIMGLKMFPASGVTKMRVFIGNIR